MSPEQPSTEAVTVDRMALDAALRELEHQRDLSLIHI